MAGFQTTTVAVRSDFDAPDGHTVTTNPTALSSVTATERLTLTLPASGFRAATAAAGFDALAVDVETAVETWVGTTLGVNTGSKNVDYIATIFSVEPASIYTNDANTNYTVGVEVKVRVY